MSLDPRIEQKGVSSRISRRAVLVLGMHRAGTSALARVLSIRGAELPNELMPANEGNPSGYWEPRAIVDFNDRLLAYFGVEWNDPFAAEQISPHGAIPERFYQEAAGIVESEYGDAELLVLKDPRCTLLPEFWNEVLVRLGIETVVVVIMRPYLEVAESLRRRDGTALTAGVILYNSYAAQSIAFGCRHDATFITYEQLLGDWRGTTDRIAVQHGFQWPRGGAAAAAEIEMFLQPGAGVAETRVGGIPPALQGMADALWEWLKASASGEPVADVAPVLAELESLSALYAPVLAERTLRMQRMAARIDFLESREKELHAMFEDSQGTLAIAAVQRDEALKQRDEVLRQRDELTARAHALEAVEEKFRQIVDHRDELTARLQTLDAMEEKFREVVGQRDEFQKDRDKLLDLCRELEKSETRIMERVEALESSKDELLAHIEASDAFVESLCDVLDDVDARTQGVLDERASVKIDREQLRSSLFDLKNELAETEALVVDTEARYAATRAELDDVLSQHSELCGMHEDALVRLDRVSSQRDAIIFERDGYRSQLDRIYASRSWALTRPFRGAARLGRRVLAGPIRAVLGRGRQLSLPRPESFGVTSLAAGGDARADGGFHEGLRKFLDAEFGGAAAMEVAARVRGFGLPVDVSEVRSAAITTLDEDQACAWAREIAERIPLSSIDRYRPEVSIVIPVFNQARFTLACLDSLISHRTRYSFEVLIGDDGSSDATGAAFAIEMPGVTVVRHADNLGFVRNCNATATHARGRFIVFLNNDTLVLPNWLDELIDCLLADAAIGLVGSKLIYPDGRMQECGAIVWNDGSAWNFGRFDDPRRPEYCYLRDTDYVSGASIALRRDLWQRLGGFDELFAPAYAEDADLAFRVRDQGLRTVVQPLSQIIHFEGVTSGTDTSQGAKAYQVENLKKLTQRWQAVIAGHRANAQEPEFEKERSVRHRVLFIDHVTPTPDADAGSVVAWEVMQSFLDHGFKVTFIPEDNFAHMGADTARLQRIGIETIYHPSYSFMADFLGARHDPFDVIFLHRYKVAEAHLHDLRRQFPQAKVMFLNADMHFLREMREAELAQDRAAISQALKTRSRELGVVKSVDCTLVHSTVELDLLRDECPDSCSSLFPLVHDPVLTPVGLEGREGVCFVGGYRHPPNVDAALWLVNEVWPLVLEERPDEVLYIVGSHAPDEVIALGAERNVEFVGFVDNLDAFLEKRRVSVAPLRYGAGAKGKVASSLAQGLPVVCTTIAAEGMQLTPDKNVLIGDSPAELARHLVTLLSESEIWGVLADEAIRYADEVTARRHARYRIRSQLEHLGVI
ncbi:glycosyltransferase [Lysobacter maris]|uniref:Glycosyltransferase n=1 Tax=Marilutibacter maris TaxID=1605891 RepID=A0A508ANW0_9GAMM|nr:glycosyltransferase [Lysobacter maris]KAB8179311.1 glycosyltransferase [Lysobacter maris]